MGEFRSTQTCYGGKPYRSRKGGVGELLAMMLKRRSQCRKVLHGKMKGGKRV